MSKNREAMPAGSSTHAAARSHAPSLEYIGINCFDGNGDTAANTGLKELRLPKVRELDDNALVGFASLRYIYAPSLKIAASGAMSRNASLAEVYAPKLTQAPSNIFDKDPKLTKISMPGK